MKNILIDSSVWIEYFRGSERALLLNDLIDRNLLCINDLILSELIPFLKQKKQHHLITILNSIHKINLEINWQKIIDYQTTNLKNGINKVGIPDLIIIQNLLDNDLELFTFDNHFVLMQKYLKFKLIS